MPQSGLRPLSEAEDNDLVEPVVVGAIIFVMRGD